MCFRWVSYKSLVLVLIASKAFHAWHTSTLCTDYQQLIESLDGLRSWSRWLMLSDLGNILGGVSLYADSFSVYEL
jgi:hypothetical protein